MCVCVMPLCLVVQGDPRSVWRRSGGSAGPEGGGGGPPLNRLTSPPAALPRPNQRIAQRMRPVRRRAPVPCAARQPFDPRSCYSAAPDQRGIGKPLPPSPRALLEGEWGPSRQSRSGCRAVTGDVKAVGGGGFWRLEMRLGLVLGYGNALGVESGQWGGGEGGAPPPPLQAIPCPPSPTHPSPSRADGACHCDAPRCPPSPAAAFRTRPPRGTPRTSGCPPPPPPPREGHGGRTSASEQQNHGPVPPWLGTCCAHPSCPTTPNQCVRPEARSLSLTPRPPSDVLERPYTVGGGGATPPPPPPGPSFKEREGKGSKWRSASRRRRLQTRTTSPRRHAKPPPRPPPLLPFQCLRPAKFCFGAFDATMPRGFTLQIIWPAFGGDHRGTLGGGGGPSPSSIPTSGPPPTPPSNTSLPPPPPAPQR